MSQNTSQYSLGYDVKESVRARNVTLKVIRDQGLVVVVPRNFDAALVPEIVESRRNWVDSQLQRFAAQPGKFDQNWPPRSLLLEGVGVQVHLRYLNCTNPQLHLRQDGGDIVVHLPALARPEHLARLFTNWLRELAARHLPAVVEHLASNHGYQYKKVIVRAQKTRWGSYSSLGTLSLNYKLVFLPKRLLRYVVLHELVHSVHMNHSANFWSELAAIDGCAREHDQELGGAWQYIPPWLD